MKDMFIKLVRFIGIDNSTKCYFNSFIIGNNSYLIFEFSNDKSIIDNKIVDKLVIYNINFYWFRSYSEFENNMDYLQFYDDRYLFIIIG